MKRLHTQLLSDVCRTRAGGNQNSDRDQEPRAIPRARRPSRRRRAPRSRDHLRRAVLSRSAHGASARPRAARSARRLADRRAATATRSPTTASTSSGWSRQSMLTDANRLASQLSGQGSMWQNPYAHPDPRAALERASVWFTAYPLSFVTRRGRDVPVRARRPGAVAGVPRDRHRRRPHRPGQAGRRAQRAPPDALGRRPLRPHQHAGRPRVRHRGRVPPPVRDRRRVRGHGDRRHRPRPHRQGRRLPPGRDGPTATTRASTTWSRSAPDDWHLLPDVPDGRDSRQPRRRHRGRARARRLHHRPACSA